MARRKAAPSAAPAAGLAGASASADQVAGAGDGAEQGDAELSEDGSVEADGELGIGEVAGGNGAGEIDAAGEGELTELTEQERQYPIADVLRNNGSGEFSCRSTGLFLSPGASLAVTIRDAEHLAALAEAIEAFDRTQQRPGLLKFDTVAL